MKKRLITIMLLFSCTFLMSCGNGTNGSNSASETSNAKEDSKKVESVKRDFPEGSYSDTGSGTFIIDTPSGNSADGSVPILFIDKDSILIQIGYSSEDFDGSHLSYIYIDGIENSKQQLGEMGQGSIDLQGNSLTVGTHIVEVVQFSTDKPDGDIITYKTCQYEVKEQ